MNPFSYILGAAFITIVHAGAVSCMILDYDTISNLPNMEPWKKVRKFRLLFSAIVVY
jgi:hypothetical protein